MCFYVLSLSLSLSVLLWMLTDAVVSIEPHSHSHSSLSLCLSATLPFPLPFKRCCDTGIIIIEIQDSVVFGCSHFIKVALIRKRPGEVNYVFPRVWLNKHTNILTYIDEGLLEQIMVAFYDVCYKLWYWKDQLFLQTYIRLRQQR
jgi:hypothetical protein